MFSRLFSHLRAKKIRSKLADIRLGLEHHTGNETEFPLGWALVPMRRAGFGGNDSAVDPCGRGPRMMTRGIYVLEPHDALVYLLDDAKDIEDCTLALRWFQWANDKQLLEIPKSELRRMSEIAYIAYATAVMQEPWLLRPKLMDNLERYADF